MFRSVRHQSQGCGVQSSHQTKMKDLGRPKSRRSERWVESLGQGMNWATKPTSKGKSARLAARKLQAKRKELILALSSLILTSHDPSSRVRACLAFSWFILKDAVSSQVIEDAVSSQVIASWEREGYHSERDMGSADLYALARTRMPILMRRGGITHFKALSFRPCLDIGFCAFAHTSPYLNR